MIMLRVSKNVSWGTNLGKLKNFYKTQMAPRLCALMAKGAVYSRRADLD